MAHCFACDRVVVEKSGCTHCNDPLAWAHNHVGHPSHYVAREERDVAATLVCELLRRGLYDARYPPETSPYGAYITYPRAPGKTPVLLVLLDASSCKIAVGYHSGAMATRARDFGLDEMSGACDLVRDILDGVTAPGY